MNALTALREQLAAQLCADPLLRLASAVAVFDPFWSAFDGDEIDEDTDGLHIALQVTRSTFPNIYTDAIEQMKRHATRIELDRFLCRAITAKGIPLDHLDMMVYGIPLEAFGVDLETPEFYDVHDDLLPILHLFGVDRSSGTGYTVDVAGSVYAVGRAIAASLLEQSDPALRQVGWAFAWLFSCSGNSLVDCTDEALAEIPPLSWSSEDVAYAVELIEETDGIMRDVRAGLETLKTSPDLIAVLERNIKRVTHEREKGKQHDRNFRLDWTGAVVGAERTTDADDRVLQFRCDAA